MAITILKRPADFVNCTTPVIYEFTTDANIGNFDDYVCDVFIKSDYSPKTAIFRNVLPNRATKVFSINVADFLLSIQKYNFNFNFQGAKNLAIEKFDLFLNIRDSSQPATEIFSFDDYIFDNFVFTAGTSTVDSNTGTVNAIKIYSILGAKTIDEKIKNYQPTKNHFASAATIEVCSLFTDTVSTFINQSINNRLTINSNVTPIVNIEGIATTVIPNQNILSLTKIELNNCNNNIFAYPFDGVCKKVIQFRFYNSKGGYSYFYAESKSESEVRSKVEFFTSNYFNENENKASKVQANSEYKKTIEFSGSKIIQLKELFSDMLKAPKIEVNFKVINGNDFFIECELTGSSADRYTHFDYKLTASIDLPDNFRL